MPSPLLNLTIDFSSGRFRNFPLSQRTFLRPVLVSFGFDMMAA